MDTVSMQEIRLIARKLASFRVGGEEDKERRNELLQSLEFILEQEEQQQHDTSKLIPYSVESYGRFSLIPGDKPRCDLNVSLVPHFTMVIRGLYINGEPALFGSHECDTPKHFALHGLRLGNIMIEQPILLRGQIMQVGTPLHFELCTPDTSFMGQCVDITLLGLRFEDREERRLDRKERRLEQAVEGAKRALLQETVKTEKGLIQLVDEFKALNSEYFEPKK